MPLSRRGSNNSDSFLQSIIQGVRQEFNTSDDRTLAFNMLNIPLNGGTTPIHSPAAPHRHQLLPPSPLVRSSPSHLRRTVCTKPGGSSARASLVLVNVNSPSFDRIDRQLIDNYDDVDSINGDVAETDNFMLSPKLPAFAKNSPRSRKYSLQIPMQVKSFKEIMLNKRRHSEAKMPGPEEGGQQEGAGTKAGSKLLRYEFTKDQVYLGEVVDYKAHGHGVLHCKECVFGGLWENGMERIGSYLWPSGVQYHGTWEKGYRQGTGVEKHAHYHYKGEWVKDCKQGYGVLGGETGGKYEGTWHNNLRDGYGMEIYKDGGFYVGQFNKGTREGQGVRVFSPNAKLRDAFTNLTGSDSTAEVPSAADLEQKHGVAIFEQFEHNDKTEIYRGYWKEDKRNGPGAERTSSGEVYEGYFKDNMRHGYGVVCTTEGVLYFGRFKKNKVIRSTRTVIRRSHKAAELAKEACTSAHRKTWLALSRVHGARRFASWADLAQREAYKHSILAENKEQETRYLIQSGAVPSINIVAESKSTSGVLNSPANFARIGLHKLTDMFSPLPSRKSYNSSCSDGDDMSPVPNRKTPVSRQFLKPV